jgi:hypothetical protein
MRSLGTVLLIVGFLLCVSIAWAALGFLMMAFGLICFLIGERKNKQFASGTTTSQRPLSRSSNPNVARVPQNNISAAFSYDREKWISLIENDPTLLRLVQVLRPYGQKYVDQLAAAYLVLNDKEYLPMILKKVVETAKRDASRNATDDPEVRRNPASPASGPSLNRARALRAVYNAVSDDPASAQEDTLRKRRPAPTQAQSGFFDSQPDGARREQKPQEPATKVMSGLPEVTAGAIVWDDLDDADHDLVERIHRAIGRS